MPQEQLIIPELQPFADHSGGLLMGDWDDECVKHAVTNYYGDVKVDSVERGLFRWCPCPPDLNDGARQFLYPSKKAGHGAFFATVIYVNAA